MFLDQFRFALTLSAMLLLCASALVHAQRPGRDSTAYVTRLGQDTIAIERVMSTRDSILGEVVDRYPRTERFTYAARLTPTHEIAGYTISFYSTPADHGDDTVRIETKYGPVRAVVDRSGHIQSFSDVGGTMQAIAPSGEATGIMTFTWDTTVGRLPIHSAPRNGS
jgi:hypothetical protein